MKIVNVIIAIAAGLIVLLGYFFGSPALQELRSPLLDWAVTLSGIAGLVAVLNLVFGVHLKRLRENHPRKGSSVVILASFAVTLIAGIFLGPADDGFQNIVTHVQVPIESSLMAVLSGLEVIRAICPFGDDSAGKVLLADTLSLRFRTLSLPKDPACST